MSDEIYKNIIEATSDYITLMDLTGHYIYASPSHIRMGYKPGELVGKSVMDRLHPEDKLRILPILMDFAERVLKSSAITLPQIKKDAAALRINSRFSDKSGRYHFLETILSIVENPGGHGYVILLISRDVTERRTAEDEVNYSEERYRLLVETARDIIFTVSKDGLLTSLNPAFENITGWQRSDWIGKPFVPLVHPEDMLRSMKILKSILKNETVSAFEMRFRAKSGAYKTAELSVIPQVKDGKIIGLLGIAHDITERKGAEDALRKSAEEYRTLVDYAPVGIYRTSLKGEILYANDALVKMLGYETQEELMAGGAIAKYKNPDDRAKFIRVLKKTGRVVGFETELLTKTGEPKNIYLSAVIAGDILSGMIIDVTERKKAEEAVNLLSRQNELVLNAAGEGIMGLDTQGKISFVNPAAANLLGYGINELIGKPSHATYHYKKADGSPYPAKECPVYAAYKDGQIHHVVDEVFWKKDGTKFSVEYTSTPIQERGKLVGAVVTFKDITQRKQAEEELSKFRLGLERSSEAVFITDVKGKILYVNPAFEMIYKYRREEVLGKTPRVIKSGIIPKHLYKQFWDTLLAKKVVMGEVVNKTKDGGLLNIESSSNPILDSDGNLIGFLAIQRNITERKKAEEELKNLNKELNSKIQEMERFNRLSVGRELRMIELKKRIRNLEEKYEN